MASSSVLLSVLLLATVGVLAADARRWSELQFYMHDIVDLSSTPTNATTVVVASNGNFTALGTVVVFDDPLTASPSLSSELLGRARGTYMFDSMGGPSLFLTFTAVLKNGTICFLGQDEISQPVREIAVVGGTGAYRFASGYAEIRTQELSLVTFSANLKLNVFLKHG